MISMKKQNKKEMVEKVAHVDNKTYEMLVLQKPLLPDNMKESIQNKIYKLLKDCGGSILKTDVWGKRYLAYNMEGFDEGYYVLYNISIDPKYILKLNKELKVTPDILRVLITNVL